MVTYPEGSEGPQAAVIDWDRIDTVLLDMDGTLLDLHYDNHFWLEYLPKRYADLKGISSEEALERMRGHFDALHGTLAWYCLDHWSKLLDLDIPALKREIRHMIRIRPHALEFLRRLHQSPKQVVLVTNAHPVTLDIKMAEIDIRPWFDDVVVSHQFEAAKEEQHFWERLQAQHPFDPARTLFIDDTESVLEAAREYGIAHLLTLLQPDSQRQKRLDTRFPGIHHFDEIMPGVAA
jgi:putative hydrolase of the HAD superfamily